MKTYAWNCPWPADILVYESIEILTSNMNFMQVLDTHGRLLTALGYGLWPSMVLLSEVVQTFILADFCYYYVKR